MRLDVLNATVSGWARYGRALVPFLDGFVIGTTKPTALNTGAITAEGSLTDASGIVYLAAGSTYSGKHLTGRIVVQGPNVTISDCIIDMPASATDIHAITCWTAGATNVLIDRVTIRVPAPNQSYWIGAGIHGSGFTARRCNITGTTDGIMPAGINQRAAVTIEGCYIGNLTWFADDGYPARVGSHSDGTHNDDVQAEGNLTSCTIRGNRLGTGRTSCIIVTENANTYDTAPAITDNWFEIDDATFGTMLNLAKASMTSMGSAQIKRNTFPLGTSPARMFILPAYLTAIGTAGGISASGTDHNVYTDASFPVTVYNGTANTTSY